MLDFWGVDIFDTSRVTTYIMNMFFAYFLEKTFVRAYPKFPFFQITPVIQGSVPKYTCDKGLELISIPPCKNQPITGNVGIL